MINWMPIVWGVAGFLFGLMVLKRFFPYAYRFGMKFRFWLRHGRKGKPILFVYSDSSNWKEYVEKKVLPRIGDHSVVLNWSRRREWASEMAFEAKVFDQWAGNKEFSPTALIFSSIGKVKVVRLGQTIEPSGRRREKAARESEQAFLSAIQSMDAGDAGR